MREEVEAHLNRSMKKIIKSFNIYDIKIDRFYFFSSQIFSFNSSTATQPTHIANNCIFRGVVVESNRICRIFLLSKQKF